jgi:succinyl-CoA synthetase beta subunit
VTALKQLNMDIPIVVQLSGTNSKQGIEIIREANLPVIESMSQATKMAISLC